MLRCAAPCFAVLCFAVLCFAALRLPHAMRACGLGADRRMASLRGGTAPFGPLPATPGCPVSCPAGPSFHGPATPHPALPLPPPARPGTFMECCANAPQALPLAAAVLELVRSERVHGHAEPYVRRASLLAASQVGLGLGRLAPSHPPRACAAEAEPGGIGSQLRIKSQLPQSWPGCNWKQAGIHGLAPPASHRARR